MSKIAIRINSADVVAVALQPLSKGTTVTLEAMDNVPEISVTLQEDITAGHKFALKDIKKNASNSKEKDSTYHLSSGSFVLETGKV